jgi:uncharacterized protein YcbX
MSEPSAAPQPGAEVGRVAALWRYPVKSMAAEPLDAVDVAWNGLVGDRRWAFVRDEQASNGFPWLTLRENPDLGKYHPAYVDLEKPNLSAVTVRTPSGQVLELLDPALTAELGGKARVMKLYRGAFDTMPLSLITTRTISDLGALLGRADLEVQRFRPNLLIEPAGDAPFPEDAWVGCVLRIGGMRMRVDQRDERCMVVNVDPSTGQRDPAVLRAIARDRKPCLGVYGSTVEPGRVSVGDPVVVENATSIRVMSGR